MTRFAHERGQDRERDIQADTHKPGNYRLEALPVVETYRGQPIRRSQVPGRTRYHAMGYFEFTVEMARARIEMEQALENMKAAYEAWRAERDGRAKKGDRLPGADSAA